MGGCAACATGTVLLPVCERRWFGPGPTARALLPCLLSVAPHASACRSHARLERRKLGHVQVGARLVMGAQRPAGVLRDGEGEALGRALAQRSAVPDPHRCWPAGCRSLAPSTHPWQLWAHPLHASCTAHPRALPDRIGAACSARKRLVWFVSASTTAATPAAGLRRGCLHRMERRLQLQALL